MLHGQKLRLEIEKLKKKKIAAKKVVDLGDYRQITTKPQPPVVLLVENDEYQRKGLKRVMALLGYDVLLAADGLEMAKQVEQSHFGLLMISAELPWVDGIEICTLFRSQPSLKGCPVILIIDRNDQQRLETAAKSGCDEILLRPFDPGQIKQVLAKYSGSQPTLDHVD